LNWPRAHWLVGTIALIAFLISGLYMLRVVHASHLDDITRLVFRSRHLFLLVSAVANLALSNALPSHRVQRAASIAVLSSPGLLLAAFFIDPSNGIHSSTVFRLAMYALFFAGALLSIVNRPGKITSPTPRPSDARLNS
jgi:hypothetical protein